MDSQYENFVMVRSTKHKSAKYIPNFQTNTSTLYVVNLLAWDDLPLWLQDNHYILEGYRVPSYSMKKSLSSLFHLHTEFVNIYTHLIGALGFIFLCIPIYLALQNAYPSFAWQEFFGLGFILFALSYA
jgi:hypothetical protein